MESDQTGSNTSDTVYSVPLHKVDIRDVCDRLLDKSVPEKQRRIRAEAILMIGRIFRAAERDPSQADNGDYAFEQLLASSQKTKKKKTSKPVASNGKEKDVD
jgi:X-domain of DnaJ-containing